MADITAHRMALTGRVLDGDGRASRGDRRAAFENAGLEEPVRGLIDKVARQAYQVTDEDIAAARTQLAEDEIFELTICAAIGQATRQLDSALAALAAATKDDT
jgi:hypothetical protein